MDAHTITILMPCKDQKEGFLKASIESVITQTSPEWQLFIIINSDTPDEVKNIVGSYSSDSRITELIAKKDTFASALNTGMESAVSDFVCILLSDDCFSKDAVSVLQKYTNEYPQVDFFHSARAYIDEIGTIRSEVMYDQEEVTLEYFKTHCSAAHHLLCWRRIKGIEIGGMDEELSEHGCDDYDFPWRMAEAGCVFKTIRECLYYYRIHHDFYRLTTHIPMARQIEILRKMFKKHNVSEQETERYIENARSGYLIVDKKLSYKKNEQSVIRESYFREFSQQKSNEFLLKGFKTRHFFPHRTYFLPKGGPDALQMVRQMRGKGDIGKLWEIVLYAQAPLFDKFPEDLFFDNQVVWHQQHFGRKGQVATANIYIEGSSLYCNNYLSDIVQRISRRRAYKTTIENGFKGWHYMLLNSIMNFAFEKGIRNIYSPAADLVIANIDPLRTVKRELFERVYDRAVNELFVVAKEGGWWKINIERNKKMMVIAEKKKEFIERQKTICICHDIEKGLGHLEYDYEYAQQADERYLETIREILSIEKEMRVKATYNIVGCLFRETRKAIEEDGHCVAFHSFDHTSNSQLGRCRQVDYRIKGYRPPQSKITQELSDENLCFHNFEWFASSVSSLNIRFPGMQNGIVKIPIIFDDFEMYQHSVTYEAWEQKAIHAIMNNHFIAFCLHDCYSQYWLPHYCDFLKKIKRLGTLKTLGEIANEEILCNAA